MFPLDFETKSSCPIARGHDNYFQDTDADIICLASGHLNDEHPHLWEPSMPRPAKLIDHAANGGILAASNAAFDQAAWDYLCVEKYDFPPTSPNQWICTQAQTRAAGLPSALDKAARALGLNVRKDKRGNELIKAMCIPPFKHTPELLAEMMKYCGQDWYVMRAVMMSVPELPKHLIEDYHANQVINDRGILIDLDLARAASHYAEAERAEIAGKITLVTKGGVTKSTQHKKFATWLLGRLEAEGCDEAAALMVRHVTDKQTKETKKKISSDKNVRASMMAGRGELNMPSDVTDALQLMQDAGGSAVSKFGTMSRLACDDNRVRGSLRFAGAASTLRYSAIGLQLHNFRNDAFTPEEAEHIKQQMIDEASVLLNMKGEVLPVMDTMGKLLRSAIIPAPGKIFVVADWSSIESRMTAVLSGDRAKVALFERGECAYCYAAEGIYKRPITKEKDPFERSVGKVTDLACGFLGGPGALSAMSRSLGVHIAEEEKQNIVDGWRAKHPRIVAYGDLLASMAMCAMKAPGQWFKARQVAYQFREDGALYCRLPDGKTELRYPDARVEEQEVPWGGTKPVITALKAAFTPAANAKEWPRHALWRGLLLENIVQASCAITLRDVVFEFQDDVAFHVHDEAILEVNIEDKDKVAEELQAFMETPPEWAPGLPLQAEPEFMTRYGK